MLAAVLHGATDLRVEERPEPALAPGEVRVAVACGGICGSDLSYFRKGGVGDFRLREPLTLGHEIAGTVVGSAAGDWAPAVGTRIAVNPGRACLHCAYCRAGRGNLCRDMRFLGSAARMPHVQGGFSTTLDVRPDQCVAIPDGLAFRVAACAEPLAVALHAMRRAGPLLGRRVLVAGAGPIGLLCLAAARLAGADAVTVSDLAEMPLRVAHGMGAAAAVRVVDGDDALAREAAAAGGFEVAFEATGSAGAVASLPALMRPGGRIVQLGMLPPGLAPVAVNLMMAREIDMVGSFRFCDEFADAVAALAGGRIDVSPLLSARFPLAEAAAAFAMAGDRSRAIKVHLDIA